MQMLHDRLYRLILALDNPQWEEKQHPRDKTGQFSSGGGVAKKSQVSNAVGKPLTAHGFKIKSAGEAKYNHPSGHEIYIPPLPEGQKFYTSNWHDPKSGKSGAGGVSLKHHFASLGLSPTLENTITKQPKPTPTFEHPKPQYAEAIAKFGGIPVKEIEASQHYKFPNGTLLAIKKKPGSMYSSLVKWAMTKPDGQIEKHKGHVYLSAALLKAEGTPVGSAPLTTKPVSGIAAYKKAAEKVTAAGFKSTGASKSIVNGTSGYDRYILGSDTDGNLKASVAIHPETGNFRMWKAGTALADKPGAKSVGSGYAITGTADKFDAAFEALHPRGTGGQFLKKPSETVDVSAMTKIGPQLGSNSGGQYEDAQGQRYYVKETQSANHAKNENLAASLYQLAGSNTLTYRKSNKPNAVITEMAPLAANNVSQLTPEQRKRARVDFAIHAWLANWDAAGLSGDNVGVIAGTAGQPDRVATLDVGGALAYRAKGGEKGHLFGNVVNEWDTLRNASQNPTSATLFKDMSQDELKASVAKVVAVTPYQIREAVRGAGYEGGAQDALVDKLVARQKDLVGRMSGEANKPPPPPAYVPPFQFNFSSDKMYELNEAAPKFSGWERNAVQSYSGGGYTAMNKALRYGYHAGGKEGIAQITSYLDKASMPEEVIVSRKVEGDYGNFLTEIASHGEGTVFTDLGFASTSLDPSTWSGDVQMVVRIPKGAKAAAIQHASQHKHEMEILVQRGSRFTVVGYEKSKSGYPTHKIYCELDQSHLMKV